MSNTFAMQRFFPAISRGHIHAFGIWLIVFVASVSTGLRSDGWWQIVLFLGSAGVTLLLWRLIAWRDHWSSYLAFGAVLLLVCSINRIFYIADFWLHGPRFAEWPFYSAQPEWSLLKGEVLTLVGTVVTVFVWLAAGGGDYSPATILAGVDSDSEEISVFPLIFMYVVSLCALLVAQAEYVTLSTFGQLLPSILGVGSVCALFLPIVIFNSSIKRIVLVVLLSTPFVYVSLLAGMKENLIVALGPAGYVVWTETRSKRIKLALVGGAVLVAGLITMYVQYYREEVWLGGRSLTQAQALGEVTEIIQFEGFQQYVVVGIERFISRSNASTHRGWAIALADEQRHEPELVFGPLLYVFIPRAIWPNKPEIKQGWEFSGLVFGTNFTSWSDSSTAAGLYPSLYLGYGWVAVIVGAAGIGLMMARLTMLAQRIGGNMLVGLFSFTLLPYTLRLDETWAVGALSAPIVSFVYITAIFLLARLISPIPAVVTRNADYLDANAKL